MKTHLKTLATILGGATLVLSMTGFAQAADYPNKTVKIIVPYGPGGTTDLVGRAIADSLSKQLGQSVIIENKPGAAGAMGVLNVKNAKPDGYTLTLTPVGIFRQPHIQKVNYDPIEDVSYIASLWTYDFLVTVPKDSPYKDMKELVEDARKNPGAIAYSTPGQYTGNQVVLAMLGKDQDIEFSHIPYKGDAEAINAVMGGHTEVAVPTNSVLPYTKSGELRVLASSDEERNEAFGDVPTLKELGYDVVVPSPLGLGGPKDLPDDVIEVLEEAAKKALEDENVKQIFAKFGLRDYYLDHNDYTNFAKENFKKEEAIVKDLDLDKN